MKSKKNILITGGAGYIGSAVARSLRRSSYTPILFDKKQIAKWGSALRPMVCVQGNIANATQLKETFFRYKPVAVIHCAAYVSIADSMRKPYAYYVNNLISGNTLLRVMDEHGCRSLIFTSSAAVYGAKEAAIAESERPSPESVYASSKQMFEEVLEFWDKTKGIKSVILRLFNVVGETDKNNRKLIPQILRTFHKKQKSLLVHGNDFKTKDGTAVRDYVSINDVVEAIKNSLEYVLRTKTSNVFNIGSGVGKTVLEVVRALESAALVTIPVKFVDKKPNEIAISAADPTKAKRILGWQPRETLEMILTANLE